MPIQFGHGTKDNNNNERARMRKLTQEEYETLDECLPDGTAIRRFGIREECLAIVTWGDDIVKDEKKTFLLLGIALAEHNSVEANNLIEALSNAEMGSTNIAKCSWQTYFKSIQLPDGVLAKDEE